VHAPDEGTTGSGPARMPEAELAIDGSFVRDLLERQLPQYASRRVEFVANGWDNCVYRLGEDLAVRLPRRAAAVPLVDSETRWLPSLATVLPLEVPYPVHRGEPDGRMPWAWSVVRWVSGAPADHATAPSAAEARSLAGFLGALGTPAPHDAPVNPFRGVPLAARDAGVRRALRRVDHPGAERCLAIWEESLGLPEYRGPAVWVHGDLHPANLIRRDGRLVGVVDWGDLTAGDPACDLQVAWTWCDGPGRAGLLEAAGSDGLTVARARANALAHGLACLAGSADNPRMAAIGAATVREVLADHAG